MKKCLLVILLLTTISTSAQKLVLKKGVVLDSIKINDSIPESFSLFLPTKFDMSKTWPIIYVFDLNGSAKRTLSAFAMAAEKNGYVLAASNNLRDSLSISQNILIANRMFNSVFSLLPIAINRSYTAGFATGARMAFVAPSFIKGISGVISCGASIANTELLTKKNQIHYIGLVGDKDFNYLQMLTQEVFLNNSKIQNQLLVFDGGHNLPSTKYLSMAMQYFTLASIAKKKAAENKDTINMIYKDNLIDVGKIINEKKPLLAEHRLFQMIRIFQAHNRIDTLKIMQKSLKKSKNYKMNRRSQNAEFFKEDLVKKDFEYFLEDDIRTYNYNNLGWWTFQMETLNKFQKSTNDFEKRSAYRLIGYLNALIADHIDIINIQNPIDHEALNFLWMLKTITAPKEFNNYLKVISYNARINEIDTSLFYLEELLMQGYTNKEKLYSLENTSLLRITPEFNDIVAKYLKEARYEIIED